MNNFLAMALGMGFSELCRLSRKDRELIENGIDSRISAGLRKDKGIRGEYDLD